MKRGILLRRSQAARLARLLGALALPVLVLTALGSRTGLVPGSALVPALGLGFALAVAALAAGIAALVDIWRSGAEGAGAAIAGMIYAAPVLLILSAIVAAAVLYPQRTEVSTDPVDPPQFVARAPDAAVAAPDDAAGPAAPVAPRIYAQPIAAVFTAVRGLIDQRGWEVVHERPPASLPAEPAPKREPAPEVVDEILNAKATLTQSRGEALRTPPGEPARQAAAPARADLGEIEAVAKTPIFGFPDDVIIRLRETPEGTRVDVRSASRIGRHDLGQNERRVNRLLADLDLALQPTPAQPGAAPPVAAAPPPSPVAEAPGGPPPVAAAGQ